VQERDIQNIIFARFILKILSILFVLRKS